MTSRPHRRSRFLWTTFFLLYDNKTHIAAPRARVVPLHSFRPAGSSTFDLLIKGGTVYDGTRAGVEETGGQLIEHFLMKAIRGEETLQKVRHRMLAGSPLYFAGRLPRALLHYGNEDPYVPVRNGLQLVTELKRQRIPSDRYRAFFYPGEGHDTDRIAAPVLSRRFIARMLKLKRPW